MRGSAGFDLAAKAPPEPSPPALSRKRAREPEPLDTGYLAAAGDQADAIASTSSMNARTSAFHGSGRSK